MNPHETVTDDAARAYAPKETRGGGKTDHSPHEFKPLRSWAAAAALLLTAEGPTTPRLSAGWSSRPDVLVRQLLPRVRELRLPLLCGAALLPVAALLRRATLLL